MALFDELMSSKKKKSLIESDIEGEGGSSSINEVPQMSENEQMMEMARQRSQAQPLIMKKDVAEKAGIKPSQLNEKNAAGATSMVRGAAVASQQGQDPKELSGQELKSLDPAAPKEEKLSKEDLTAQERLHSVLLASIPTLLGAAFGGAEGASIGAKVGGEQIGLMQAQKEKLRQEGLSKEEKAKEMALKERHAATEEAKAKSTDEYQKGLLAQQREKLAMDKQLALMGPEAKDFKPEQVASAIYGKRAESALGIINNLMTKKGFDPTKGTEGIANVMPDLLKSEDRKLFDQAYNNLMSAVLRKESGAAISKDEKAEFKAQYRPVAGDTPEVVAQKYANAQQFLEGMKLASGGAWTRMASVQPQPIIIGKRSDSQKYVEGLGQTATAASPQIMDPQDRAAAVSFIKNNPGDPKVAKIKQMLGM